MPNSYYNHGSFPSTGSAATSASMRAELQLIGLGFDKLPTLSGNQNKIVVVNNTGTGLLATDVLPPFDAVDNSFLIRDNADATRKFRFEASTVTAGQTRVLTVPDANTTIVGTDTTQTLTNKTLTLPVIAQISNTGTLTLPTATDTLVGRATTDTLTNKTLTAPVIATIVNVGTLTLPTLTDTLVGRATTDTLTNKTISGASNTLTNIGNGSLVNSAVTIGSTSLSLGGTMTALSGVTISGSSNTISNIANASLVNSSVTIGATNVALGATAATVTGLTLTGSAFNGTVGATTPSTGAFTTLSTSGAATLNSGTVGGSNIVSESGSQTLTNKSISGSANTLTNIANASLVNSSLTIGSTNIALGATSTTLAGLTSVSSTSFTGALTGNASTATTLATARNINGTAFNGSADITTASWGTARTLSIGGTGKSVDGSGNVTWSTSEIAANTAITLANTRTLWGQNFNGSANVSGSLTSVGDITGSGAITLTATGGNLTLVATGANAVPISTNGVERIKFDSTGVSTSSNVNLSWAGELSEIITQLTGGIDYVNDIAGVTAKAISGGNISLALGSATQPSLSLTGNKNTGIYFPAANTLGFTINGGEAGRFNSLGYLGLGQTNPTEKLDVNGTAKASAFSTAGNVTLTWGGELSEILTQLLGGINYVNDIAGVASKMFAGDSAYLALDSNSAVLIGTNASTGAKLTVLGDQHIRSGYGLAYYSADNSSYWSNYNSSGSLIFSNGSEKGRFSSTGEFLVGGSTDNGAYNIQCNGTAVWGAGAYVNGSDARIKKDIAAIDSGLDVIEKLNPVTYRYKEDWLKDQSVQTGFIAQELLVALEGKTYIDGVVQQGGAKGYYSVAYQNLIPILTKAIQELNAKIEAQAAEIEILKGN